MSRELSDKLIREWHPTKNGKLTPKDVTCGSGKKVWWLCKKGHDWKAVISSRSNGCGCPYCSNSTSYPDKLIHFTMSKIWGVDNVFLRHKIRLLDDKIEADCFIKPLNVVIEYDGHFYHKNKRKDEEKATKFITANYNYISIREKGLSPLSVAGIKTFILDNNSDLDIKLAIIDALHYIKNSLGVSNDILNSIDDLVYYLSYSENIKLDVLKCYEHNNNNTIILEDYPILFEEWDTNKNKGLSLSDFNKSHFKAWWTCKNGHSWKAAIKDRVRGTGCPYCAGKKVCKDNSLETLKPELAKEWHPTKNEDLSPKNVTQWSDRSVWWMCEKGHEWESRISNRTKGNRCPFCSGKKVCDDNCLATLNPELAKEWHPTKNGELTPKDVTCGSNKKVWWMCKKGHEWEAKINNRSNGRNCPHCSGKKID